MFNLIYMFIFYSREVCNILSWLFCHDVVGKKLFHVSTKVTTCPQNVGVGRKTVHEKCKILSIYELQTRYVQLGCLWRTFPTLICTFSIFSKNNVHYFSYAVEYDMLCWYKFKCSLRFYAKIAFITSRFIFVVGTDFE